MTAVPRAAEPVLSSVGDPRCSDPRVPVAFAVIAAPVDTDGAGESGIGEPVAVLVAGQATLPHLDRGSHPAEPTTSVAVNITQLL